MMYEREKKKEVSNEEVNKNVDNLVLFIDCNRGELTVNQTFVFLEEEYFGEVIPYPTIITESGNGLFLYWKLSHRDEERRNDWNIVQKWFKKELEALGAEVCDDVEEVVGEVMVEYLVEYDLEFILEEYMGG